MNDPVSLRAAFEKVDTPAYVYALGELSARCSELQALRVRRKKVLFAAMANDHPAILKAFVENGVGVFVNSPRQLRAAMEVGCSAERIVYAASGMSRAEVALCAAHGVHIVADSVQQLSLVGEIGAHGQEVSMRMNLGAVGEDGKIAADPSYRFGINYEDLGLALRSARKHGIHISGIHSYFGTDIVDSEVLLSGLEKLSKISAELPDLKYIDVAGGFGVPDQFGGKSFDLDRYGRGAELILSECERSLGRELYLVLEPGRYLSASCGYFIVTVTDIKVRRDRVFVGTDGSVAIFPRPLFYPERAKHPCQVVGRERDLEFGKPQYICGNSTYSKDFLARGVVLPLPAVGDRIVFHNAGAYCRSMITEFLGKDRPRELVLQQATTCTRETIGSYAN